jgi:capsular polysaccharide transport system permease protein
MDNDGLEGNKSFARSIARRIETLPPLFLITVLVPTVCAIFYYGVIASDTYISEAHFAVHTQSQQALPSLSSLIKGGDIATSGIEGKAVRDYVKSRDALTALNAQGRVAAIYSRPQIDIFNRLGMFDSSPTTESLLKYYNKRVTIEEDSSTNITILRVRAYTAEDAYWINEQLLERSESLVNFLNQRSREDLIKYAAREVIEAKQKAADAAIALAQFRNREGIIDPEKQATVSLQMISKLQDDLSASKMQLLQLRTLAPQNPQVEVLDARVTGLQKEIDEQLGKVAGGQRSLANSAVQYQRLYLNNQFADRLLTSALITLEAARNDARRQQAYVERIVQPNKPDEPLEPKRWRGIFTTLVLGLAAWGILTMLIASVREHQD